MDEPLDFDQFAALVAPIVGRDHLAPDDLLAGDLGLDLGEAFALAVALDRIRPGFAFPFQMDFEDIRLRDVHHYLTLPASD